MIPPRPQSALAAMENDILEATCQEREEKGAPFVNEAMHGPMRGNPLLKQLYGTAVEVWSVF